jgi:2-hydroxychromene-2-carboxylate isomerase
MTTETLPIDFYFDFASPYGYLGSLQIDAVAARHGRTVAWRPILLGVVFKLTGMKANMHQPLRGDYLRHDTARCARELRVPYTFPKVMPLNPVAASRAVYWLESRDVGRARALAAAIYHAHWGEGRDLESPEAVAEVAASLGLDRAAVLDGIQQPEVKDRLRRETDTAIARGVFGAPFFFVDGEPFWGADRIAQIDHWLATGGW